MPASRQITAFMRWRWSPCIGLVAVTLAAGYLGIQEKLQPTEPLGYGELKPMPNEPHALP